MAFCHVMRLKAEAIFAARKDKAGFVPCEFVDYKGEFGSLIHFMSNPSSRNCPWFRVSPKPCL